MTEIGSKNKNKKEFILTDQAVILWPIDETGL